MLQSIRETTQGWVAGAIISVVGLSFAYWGIHNYLNDHAGHADGVASVNGKAIPSKKLQETYYRLRQQQQMQLGADFVLNPQVEAQLKNRALNQLITTTLLSQDAYKQNFRVTESEINTFLANMPAFQINGQFSRDRLRDFLNSTYYTESAFLDDLSRELVISQLRAGYMNSAFALPNEVQKQIELIGQKRDIGYFVIPKDIFFKDIKITEQQALDYYQKHKNQFMRPEQVKIEYLELSIPQLAANLHFTHAQLQQYYKDNIENYTRPQRWHMARILVRTPPQPTPLQTSTAQTKANTLLQRIHSGENFAKLAEQFSDDTVSAKQGGVMDWLSHGSMDISLESALRDLKINEISQPIKTKEGFSIVKLIAMQKAQVMPFEEVKSQVEKALAQQKAQQLFAEKADKLSNLTYANPTTLEVAAKALDLPIQNSEQFGAKGTKEGITANPKIILAAFNQEVMVRGNNSDIIELNPETLIVLRDTFHQPAAPQAFNEVKEQISIGLRAQAAQMEAQHLGDRLVEQLKITQNPEQVANQHHFKYNFKSQVGRYDTKFNSAIVNAAFRVPHPSGHSTISGGGIFMPSGDYAVIIVSGIYNGDANSANPNGNNNPSIYQEQVEKLLGQTDYQLYVQGLARKSKIGVKS